MQVQPADIEYEVQIRSLLQTIHSQQRLIDQPTDREYEIQIRALLQTIHSQRRLIEALRTQFCLIQVIVGECVSGVLSPSESQNLN